MKLPRGNRDLILVITDHLFAVNSSMPYPKLGHGHMGMTTEWVADSAAGHAAGHDAPNY